MANAVRLPILPLLNCIVEPKISKVPVRDFPVLKRFDDRFWELR